MAIPAPLFEAHRRSRLWRSRPLPDLLAGATAVTAALILSWPLFVANDLDTAAGDWPAHAFRVREVLENGLTSWSHVWAGGMPLWEGYQAAPHLITAGLVALTGVGVTTAMAMLAGLLLVVLRAGTYLAARMLGAPPVAALIGSLLTVLLDTVRQPIANYSELWGLAFTPIMLAAGYRWSGRPGGLVVAAVAGGAVELHPHLAILSAVGLVAGYLCSHRQRSFALLVGQGGLFLLGSAVFWLPVVLSARPAYAEPYFVSSEFARLLFSLATAGFIAGWPVIVAGTAAAGLIASGRRADAAAIRFLLVSGLIVGIFITASLLGRTPEALRTAQLSRTVSVVPVLAGLLVAVLIAPAARRAAAPAVLWGLALVLFSTTLIRNQTLPTSEREVARTHPAVATLLALGAEADGRVLAGPVVTAYGSSIDTGSIRYGGSYSGREWSILHGPAEVFLYDSATAEKRTAFLVALGVEYVVLPEGMRPEIIDPEGGSPGQWRLIASAGGLDLLRAPWKSAMAWHIAADRRSGLTVPDESFRTVESAYVRDVIVGRLAGRSLGGDTRPAAVRYPDGSTIVVTATGLDGRRYLAVNENWDRTWTASANGITLPVERFGANQIGVDLAGVTGDATVTLRHRWPVGQVAGLALTGAAVPIAAGWWTVIGRRARKGRRDEIGHSLHDGDSRGI